MKKTLFILACSPELKIVKSEIKKINIQGIKVSFLLCGIGNYNTIFNLTKILEEKKYDFVVNVGVCGWKYSPNPNPSPLQEEGNKEILSPEGGKYPRYEGDWGILQISRIFNLSNSKELIPPVFFKFGKLESIACSEVPIYDSEKLQENNYVDMESYGVEYVCDKYKVPRIILKVPVDEVGEETKNFDYKNALDLLQKNINYKDLLEKISIYLDKIPQKIDLSKYFDHYKMTHSERLIFEIKYNKYKTLVGNDFDDFFEENKGLDKKEFLNIL